MKISEKNLSDKTVTNILYAVSAVIILTVVVLTIMAFAMQNRSVRGSRTTASSPDPVTEPITANAGEQNDDKQSDLTTAPEDGDEPTTVIVDEPVSFSIPCDGYPSKTYDVQNLSYSLTMNDLRTHEGVDIAADEGSEVKAAADGEISAVYRDVMMGNCIAIDHKDGFVSIYKNLGPELPEGIAEGAKVSKGDVIGAVGSSALIEQADEPHLHFELKANGANVDPLEYIDMAEETMSHGYEDE